MFRCLRIQPDRSPSSRYRSKRSEAKADFSKRSHFMLSGRPKSFRLHQETPQKNRSRRLWGKFSSALIKKSREDMPWKIHYRPRRLKSVSSQQLDADWEPFNLWTILGVKIQRLGNGYAVCNHRCRFQHGSGSKQIASCQQSPSFLNECFFLNRDKQQQPR